MRKPMCKYSIIIPIFTLLLPLLYRGCTISGPYIVCVLDLMAGIGANFSYGGGGCAPY